MLLRGALLSAAVLASVATSNLPSPSFNYQVDLVTRQAAVYELFAIGARGGGFEEVDLQLWIDRLDREPEARVDAGAPDAGEADAPSVIRVIRLDRRPTAADLQTMGEGGTPQGGLVLAEASRQQFSFSERIPVTTEPRWLLFLRSGPGAVVRVMLAPPCEEFCGDLLLEDVTLSIQ
jgi:hypothetical protein